MAYIIFRPVGRVLYHNTNGRSALNGNVNDLIASINNGASVRNVITRLGLAASMDNVQVVLLKHGPCTCTFSVNCFFVIFILLTIQTKYFKPF